VTQIRAIQTNFSSGEVDPLMKMRVDTGAWKNGAATLLNASLFNTGGVGRRPGTWHREHLHARARLIPFEFSGAEKYVIALLGAQCDIYSSTGTFLQSIFSAVWFETEIFDITYAQVADTMVLAHTRWMPQLLRRTSGTTFELVPMVFAKSVTANKTYQPYYKFAPDEVTLSASANTGSVTLTTSADVFSSDMIGSHLRWFDVEILLTAYASPTSMTGTVLGILAGTYDINPFRTVAGDSHVEITHVGHGFVTGDTITLLGANAVGGIDVGALMGDFIITVLDDNRYAILVGDTATDSIDGGGPNVKYQSTNTRTRDWSEPSFSWRNGYPGAVCFHEGRLWFGGTPGQPDGLWSSKTYHYFNFDVGEGLPTDSIQITVGADEISNVRHLVSHRDLQIFSTTCEFYAPSPSDSGLTPTSIKIRRQTPYGSSMVTPKLLDGATLFLQNTKTALREFTYVDGSNGYTATNLNLLTGHMIKQPHDMGVLYGSLTRSEQYAFLVNSDGTLAVFNSARSEGLAGWSKWQTEGEFDSVTVVGDEVFFSVRRHGAYHLEQLSTDRMHSLDAAWAYSGAMTDTWVVNLHYANLTVHVVSGNYYYGEVPVAADGTIVLSGPVDHIVIGEAYPFRIETLPVHVELATGPMTGRPKRISRVIVGLDTTLSVLIAGNRLIIKQVTDDFSLPPVPYTGSKEFFLLGYSRDATVSVSQDEPLPCAVLGMVLEVCF
jgi:hypothetical protein